MEKFDDTWKKKMNRELNAKFGSDRGCYFQWLFDPTQTHAAYGITEDNIDKLKQDLKKVGANRFRVVKVNGGFRILCFSAKKITS